MTTTAVCIKGRQEEFGRSLELAAATDIVYVGRSCTMGGWRLKCSPFCNPFSVQKCGGADVAVAEYARYLDEHRDLIKRARRELPGKRLGCFCKDLSRCHARLWARLIDADARGVLPILRAAGAGHPESPDAWAPRHSLASMAGGPR